jgi:universal stress protein E
MVVDRISDILVIVNPVVGDQPAMAKAAALARWLGAGIELLICTATPCDSWDSLLEQLAEPLRDDGLDITTHVISGDPLHETLISWMGNSPADLVLKDTHHHPSAKGAFITDTDWHLIRACPVPLLLTKPRPWGAPPVLMAAVDPGHAHDPSAALERRILDVTVSLANRFDAQVHAIHAYPAEGESIRSRIKRLTDEYGVADANLHVDAGIAAEYLARMAAEWRADIVTLGAISRSGLKRVLLGSTAERVLETLPCDALVVKSPDFAQNLPF